MSTYPNPVQTLVDRFLLIEQVSERRRTADQERSLLFARTELALERGCILDGVGRQIINWVERARQLDRFVLDESRFPRENNRLHRAQISAEERVLHEWVRYQRRPATRGAHCDYQAERLEIVPGFTFDPHGDAWTMKFESYARFVAVARRAPRARAAILEERTLAAWASKQRRAHADGRLTPEQDALLVSLPIWTW